MGGAQSNPAFHSEISDERFNHPPTYQGSAEETIEVHPSWFLRFSPVGHRKEKRSGYYDDHSLQKRRVFADSRSYSDHGVDFDFMTTTGINNSDAGRNSFLSKPCTTNRPCIIAEDDSGRLNEGGKTIDTSGIEPHRFRMNTIRNRIMRQQDEPKERYEKKERSRKANSKERKGFNCTDLPKYENFRKDLSEIKDTDSKISNKKKSQKDLLKSALEGNHRRKRGRSCSGFVYQPDDPEFYPRKTETIKFRTRSVQSRLPDALIDLETKDKRDIGSSSNEIDFRQRSLNETPGLSLHLPSNDCAFEDLMSTSLSNLSLVGSELANEPMISDSSVEIIPDIIADNGVAADKTDDDGIAAVIRLPNSPSNTSATTPSEVLHDKVSVVDMLDDSSDRSVDALEDPSLALATLKSLHSSRLTPLIKEELKLSIQVRRLSQNQEEDPTTSPTSPDSEGSLPHEPTDEDLRRRERRRLLNRESAVRCRERHKDIDEQLEKQADEMESQNEALRWEIRLLEKEAKHLRNILQEHERVCQLGTACPDVVCLGSFTNNIPAKLSTNMISN